MGKAIDTRHCQETPKSRLDPSKAEQNKISIDTKHNYTRFDQYMKEHALDKTCTHNTQTLMFTSWNKKFMNDLPASCLLQGLRLPVCES